MPDAGLLTDFHGQVIVGDSPAMETTINLDETYPAESGWIIASHLIMRDLVQTFGLAEPFQFDRLGRIRRKYFREAGWTEDHDIVVTDDTV